MNIWMWNVEILQQCFSNRLDLKLNNSPQNLIMIQILAIINAVLLGIISGFHFYWAFGGKVGGDVVLPEINKGNKVFTPSPIATGFVAFIFAFFGLLPLVHTGIISIQLPAFIQDYSMIGLGAIFCIRGIGEFKYLGFFKSIKGTKFAHFDTKYFSPLAFIMGLNFFIIELF